MPTVGPNSLIYAKRALPITWLVVKGYKGHLPKHVHPDHMLNKRIPIPVFLYNWRKIMSGNQTGD
jgi:hypothetical protein